MSNRESIKVVCRVRPLNKIELSGNFQNCVTHDDYMMTVKVSLPSAYLCSAILKVKKIKTKTLLIVLLLIVSSARIAHSRKFLKKLPFPQLMAF